MKRPKEDPRQGAMWAAEIPAAEQVAMFPNEPHLGLAAAAQPKKPKKEHDR